MSGLMPPGPLSYDGQVAVPWIARPFDPATSNNKFDVPTIWVNSDDSKAFILTAKPQGVADWVLIGSSGVGTPIDSIQVDASSGSGTNPVVPTDQGLVIFSGQQVPSGAVGANVIRTDSTSANTIKFQIQQSGSAASQDTTLNGACHFNSAQFSVSSGFVSLVGGGQAVDSFTTDTGGPITPNGSGNVALTGATTTFTNGNVANTVRTEVQGTDHALFVGRGANVAAANLALGTSGQVLTSNGPGVDPSFQNPADTGFSSIVSQVFTSNGTYTPTAGMQYCIVEVIGGGGGGGGVSASTVNQASVGAGGGGGGYSRKVISAATIGASQSVTIGAAGTAGASGGGDGGAGGTSSLGALLSATGGGGGPWAQNLVNVSCKAEGAAAGMGSGGDINVAGTGGADAFAFNVAAIGGQGGSSFFGGDGASGVALGIADSEAGGNATSFGGGGGGASTFGPGAGTAAAQPGGAGAAGVIVITEYIG